MTHPDRCVVVWRMSRHYGESMFEDRKDVISRDVSTVSDRHVCSFSEKAEELGSQREILQTLCGRRLGVRRERIAPLYLCGHQCEGLVIACVC
jgi:hypothetical protein